jgi:hypothetical protein
MAVKVQILLRKPCRTPEGREATKKILSSLGLTVTGEGLVTISADAEPKVIQRVFGVTLPSAEPLSDSNKLPIPVLLKTYVESITIAPPHLFFDQPSNSPSKPNQ